MNKKNTLDNRSTLEAHSLNRAQRKKEMLRITEDNLKLVKRIQNRQPVYNHLNWEEDRRKTEQYLKHMGEYQWNGPMKADLDSSSTSNSSSSGRRRRRTQSEGPSRTTTASSGNGSGRRTKSTTRRSEGDNANASVEELMLAELNSLEKERKRSENN